MTSTMDIEPRKLDFGRVIGQTFGVLGRQPLIIFGLTLVLAAGPVLLNLYVSRQMLGGGAAATATLAQFASLGYWLRVLAQALVSSFLEVCLFFVAFSEVSGRKAGFGEVMTNGAKFFLPLFAVNVLSYSAIFIGFMLLIVPGVMLALAWCVAGPALVAERTGIIQVLGRSAQLTRGNRWRILGLFLIILVVVIIVEALLGVFSMASGGMGSFLFSPVRLVIFALVSAITSAIAYTGLGVLYANLRELRDGLGHDSLAAVFD
jgi:uncharacterized membrane protein